MKISVITPSYNSVSTIEQTIQSVLAQEGIDLEYIIIDGGSTDGTVDSIKRYAHRIAFWVSERDAGIYDAMNKGIAHATGDIIAILNSDDFYVSVDVLQRVVQTFSNTSCEVCYGDIVYIAPHDTTRIVRRWVSGVYAPWKLSWGWAIPHPAFFVKKEIYDRYGLYRTDFRIAGDYEFMLRLFKTHHIVPQYTAHTCVYMREGGASAKNFSRRRLGWDELQRAWILHGLRVPCLFVVRRIILKFPQYLQRFRFFQKR